MALQVPDVVPHIPPFKAETVEQVALLVVAEINRADQLARGGRFGGTHIMPGGPDPDRMNVLVEEVGECAKAMNEIRMGTGATRDRELLTEVIQTAAVASVFAAAIIEGRG